MAMLNEAFMKADAAGAMESCLVALYTLSRLYVDRGNYQMGYDLLINFREKMASRNQNHLVKVVDDCLVRFLMYKGDLSQAEVLWDGGPNPLVFFTILDRTRYINKLEMLIPFNRKDEAIALIMRLEDVFTRYHRPYDWIKVELLKAILYFREGQDSWRSVLDGALKKAQTYGYVHVVSDLGAALFPLLEKYRFTGIDKEYKDKIWNYTRERALNYPNFMKSVEVLQEPLTDREREVIRLMCEGMSSEKICDLLGISYSGLKFHKQNVYRKLEVNSRRAAERKAKNLGLDL